MKKLFLLFMAAAIGFAAGAQTLPNAGMESWRNNTSGTAPVINIHAPISWYGFDSVIIADGQSFLSDTAFKAQLFQENSIVHTGTSSAKLLTLMQDTVALIGCTLSNASIGLDLSVIAGGGDPASALTFTGGTATTQRIMTVSAYTEYFPGIDTTTHMMGGLDTGMLTVEAICTAYGADSVIGTGAMPILPSATFTMITANVNYIDTYSTCDLIRIIFTSSRIGGNTLDSSTLYVDDVSMTGIQEHSHLGVSNVPASGPVKVYPNPAYGTLYLSGPQNAGLSVMLLSVSGQVVASRALAGSDALDISTLAPGVYQYIITDGSRGTVQQGKVSVVK